LASVRVRVKLLAKNFGPVLDARAFLVYTYSVKITTHPTGKQPMNEIISDGQFAYSYGFSIAHNPYQIGAPLADAEKYQAWDEGWRKAERNYLDSKVRK
jgi:hypothetical protein